jgi:hypothetical protein
MAASGGQHGFAGRILAHNLAGRTVGGGDDRRIQGIEEIGATSGISAKVPVCPSSLQRLGQSALGLDLIRVGLHRAIQDAKHQEQNGGIENASHRSCSEFSQKSRSTTTSCVPGGNAAPPGSQSLQSRAGGDSLPLAQTPWRPVRLQWPPDPAACRVHPGQARCRGKRGSSQFRHPVDPSSPELYQGS